MQKPKIQVDESRILSDLIAIINTSKPRNSVNVEILDEVADYIKVEFQKSSDRVEFQEFEVDGNIYKNVICSFGPENAARIIVGAHYDVNEDTDGADDNASAVVGLLEIARNLKDRKLKNRIDLVAYSLEEPPYFYTKNMGSHVHAQSLFDNKVDVIGMICLEMIGYFTDEKNTQHFPTQFLLRLFGSKGNFISVVTRFGEWGFPIKFSLRFLLLRKIRTIIFPAPQTEVEYSDHLNYWKLGYKAVMITDTAFYRNLNYHTENDTIDTLDIKRMAAVIETIVRVLVKSYGV